MNEKTIIQVCTKFSKSFFLPRYTRFILMLLQKRNVFVNNLFLIVLNSLFGVRTQQINVLLTFIFIF